MRKRLLLLFGGFALLLAGAGLGVVLLTPTSPISRESCEKIQPGMTVGEVEQLLGRSADTTVPGGDGETFLACYQCWSGPEGGILVQFDQSGQVVSAGFDEDLVLGTEPLLDRLRRRLGL